MAERKGLVARWLEGKERDEEYARSTLPTNRWSLFWDIFKGRFGRLMLTNLLMLITFLPVIAIIVWRILWMTSQGIMGPYGAGLGVGYPVIPDIVGTAEFTVVQSDLLFFGLFIPASAIAALGISGGAYIIRNLIWTEGIFVANDFLRGIRRNYWNVLEAVLLFTIFLFTARCMGNLADFYVAVGAPSAGWLVASKVVGYIFTALAFLICLWMISLGINYRQGPWQLFRNAVVMTVGTIPQTIFFALLASIPVILALIGGGFFGTVGVILLLLFGFSYFFLVWMDFSQWAFDKFINPNFGIAVGRGLYNKEKGMQGAKAQVANENDSAAMQEYRRMIVAQGKSTLVSRPIKPIDDDIEIYQLPESFSREDLQRLKESKEIMEDDVKAYAEEHKNDPEIVEYNRQFEESERALQEENSGGKNKKKKPPKPPKMLTKNNR